MAVNEELAIFQAHRKAGGPVVVGRTVGFSLVGGGKSLAVTRIPGAFQALAYNLGSELHVKRRNFWTHENIPPP